MSRVFVISAPSGSGKSTLVNRLLKEDSRLEFSISYTSRAPRGTEEDGREYHFVSREDFEGFIERDELLEWADVFGNYYGTHKNVIQKGRTEGKDIVLDIDVQGARQLKGKVRDSAGIFILPPSREVLEVRLRSRGEDDESTIRRRLAGAEAEIREHGNYDYVVVNDNLEEALGHLKAIVEAERLKNGEAMESKVKRILNTFAKSVKED